VVGDSEVGNYNYRYAIEWSHGRVINLGVLAGTTRSAADAINDLGQVVGWSQPIPKASTWDMMLLGFAGLGYLGEAGQERATRSPPSPFNLPTVCPLQQRRN
jgi:hypothetical protein